MNEYTSSLIGIQILSMSKKLMNQAFRFCDKYASYQDTDSIQMPYKYQQQLINDYEKHYERPFMGKDLGLFSSDFNDITCHKAVYVGKKLIFCQLEGKDHIKLKGIPESVIKKYVEDNEISLWDLYIQLYNGEEIPFDIYSTRIGFKADNMQISTRNSAFRIISFNADKTQRIYL